MINKDVKLGSNVKIFHEELVNIYGCEIGSNTKVASFVEIQKGAKIGRNCKIEAFAFIPTGVTIEDEVFVGPCVCFTNDKHPRAATKDGKLKSDKDWEVTKTLVKKRASIGANATIVCGVIVGENSIIGAGSVVTKDIPANCIAVGNPAKVIKKFEKMPF